MLNLIQLRSYFFSAIVILAMLLLSAESPAQNNMRIFEDIGNGSGSSQTEDTNDNTTIYIVGGLVIAGILVYALVLRDDKKDEADTTSSSSSIYDPLCFAEFEPADKNIQKVKDQIPVDIFIGMSNNEAVINDRVYQLGVRVKF